MPAEIKRPERLQVMLDAEELAAVDEFRFQKRMPSRAAAVRELMKRGLSAEGFSVAAVGVSSTNFGVLGAKSAEPQRRNGALADSNGHAKDTDESELWSPDRNSHP